jgi:HemY protein
VLAYFKTMSAIERKLRGRALLKRAWRAAPHPLIVEAFVSCFSFNEPAEKVKVLKGLTDENTTSWFSAYTLGKAAHEAGLWGIALDHFEKAYAALPVRTCAEKALELVKILHPEKTEHTQAYIAWQEKCRAGCSFPTWLCSNCAHSLEEWESFCPVCHSFASVTWSTQAARKEGSAIEFLPHDSFLE